MIKIRKIQVEPTSVYDITVPETSAFVANNIVVHNCAEIVLPTKPFKRLDPARKLIRVKKSNVDEFMKTKPTDIVKIRKIK